MINIKSGKGRRQYLREFILSMLSFERTFEKKMRSILDRQYLAVANLVKSGDTDLRNINDVIDNYSGLMTKKLVAHYRRVADFFGRQALDRINKEKGLVSPEEQKLISDFWRNIESWIKVHAAKKVTRMQEVTKKRIASIVQTNMEEGRSNQDLANSLVEKKIANKSRAKLIARTETHGCANNGIFEMMNSTKMTLEKEWLTAGDARVRSRSFDHSGADAERVHMDANFEKTGEPLMYPGDPFGSAGNVCRCRCGTLYHEVRRAA